MSKAAVRTATALALVILGSLASAQPDDALRDEVRQTEIAFARTMADRDFAAFQRLIADDVVWLGSTLMRGKQQVAEGWKRFYEEKDAPFSWEPERVEVNDSGTLYEAVSSRMRVKRLSSTNPCGVCIGGNRFATARAWRHKGTSRLEMSLHDGAC